MHQASDRSPAHPGRHGVGTSLSGCPAAAGAAQWGRVVAGWRVPGFAPHPDTAVWLWMVPGTASTFLWGLGVWGLGLWAPHVSGLQAVTPLFLPAGG